MINFPRYVNPGEAVTAQHINSVIDALRKCQPIAGANVTVDQGIFGTRINAQAKGTSGGGTSVVSSSDYPFKLRWYKKGDGIDDGEWQIYMPYGCATVTTKYASSAYAMSGLTVTYLPLNDDATDKDGNKIFQWYKLDTPQNSDAEVGEYNGYTAKQWAVHVCMKPYPRMVANTLKEQTERYQWDVVVGTIREVSITEDGETKKTRSATTTHKENLQETLDAESTFSVIYEMSGSGKDAGYEVYLTNQTRFVGRAQISKAGDTKITGWEAVWVNIKHDAESSEMEIKKEMKGEDAVSDNDHTVYKIYDIKDNIIVNDYRSAVPEMNFYTNGPSAAASNVSS